MKTRIKFLLVCIVFHSHGCGIVRNNEKQNHCVSEITFKDFVQGDKHIDSVRVLFTDGYFDDEVKISENGTTLFNQNITTIERVGRAEVINVGGLYQVDSLSISINNCIPQTIKVDPTYPFIYVEYFRDSNKISFVYSSVHYGFE